MAASLLVVLFFMGTKNLILSKCSAVMYYGRLYISKMYAVPFYPRTEPLKFNSWHL